GEACVVMVVGAPTAAVQRVTALLSSVTVPVCARRRPLTLAPVCRVMLVSARMFPTKVVVVPRVAELPTCQKALHAWPPLMTVTVEADPRSEERRVGKE